jgi:hypothetical protein
MLVPLGYCSRVGGMLRNGINFSYIEHHFSIRYLNRFLENKSIDWCIDWCNMSYSYQDVKDNLAIVEK